MNEEICFVVTGYGIKPDYRTGRKLDMDKTFQFLIKPVFEDLGINCFRACDMPHAGVIDVPMYEYILKADIVVADISTLNANAIYELGVRHALKPKSTIIIAEKELLASCPFDLNHISILPYEHLGTDIGASEALRFCKEFKNKVKAIIANPQIDSPVYTFMHGLQPPQFTPQEKVALRESVAQGDSIAVILIEAENLKNNNKFDEAFAKLEEAKIQDPNNPYIIQRMALITYKSKMPDAVAALKKAEEILKPLSPDTSNDTETLGLSGAINKRLFEETNSKRYLEKAKGYYERGFVIARDYYNGINFAFLCHISASLAEDANDKTADLVLAKRVREKVKDICLGLHKQSNFGDMPDKVWILLTLAEIEYANNNFQKEEEYLKEARAEGIQPFETEAYQYQRKKIGLLVEKISTT